MHRLFCKQRSSPQERPFNLQEAAPTRGRLPSRFRVGRRPGALQLPAAPRSLRSWAEPVDMCVCFARSGVFPTCQAQLGRPVAPFHLFLGEGCPTKIDCRKNIGHPLTSLLEDLVNEHSSRLRSALRDRQVESWHLWGRCQGSFLSL